MRLGLNPTTLSSLLPPITAPSLLEASRLAHTRELQAEDGGHLTFTQVCDAPGYDETPCS
jgi:soluble lytic murein transglycosylase